MYWGKGCSGRDKTKELGTVGHIYQGQNRLVEGTVLKLTRRKKKKRDRRPGEKSGPACMSLIFQFLMQYFAEGPPSETPSPWEAMVG